MQFVNLISNPELMDDLPITLKGDFEKKFEKIVITNPTYDPSLKYLAIMENTLTYDIQNIHSLIILNINKLLITLMNQSTSFKTNMYFHVISNLVTLLKKICLIILQMFSMKYVIIKLKI